MPTPAAPAVLPHPAPAVSGHEKQEQITAGAMAGICSCFYPAEAGKGRTAKLHYPSIILSEMLFINSAFR